MATLQDQEGLEIVAGDIEPSQLQVVKAKIQAKGWTNVKVEKLDAMVSGSYLPWTHHHSNEPSPCVG